MDNQASSAFRLSESFKQPSKIPKNHQEIWKTIQAGFKTGRTFNYASCCKAIFDNRRRAKMEEGNEPHPPHPDGNTKTLHKALGKRVFSGEDEFSSALTILETENQENPREVALNRDHLSTQNAIKIAKLENKIHSINDIFQAQVDSLNDRVTALEKENKRLTDKLESEIESRAGFVRFVKERLQITEEEFNASRSNPPKDTSSN